MTTPMALRCQITFCTILLRWKLKLWNLGGKRNSSCQMLPNEHPIINATHKCMKIPYSLFLTDCSQKSRLTTTVIMFLIRTKYLSYFCFYASEHFWHLMHHTLHSHSLQHRLLFSCFTCWFLFCELRRWIFSWGKKQINDFLRELNNSV